MTVGLEEGQWGSLGNTIGGRPFSILVWGG